VQPCDLRDDGGGDELGLSLGAGVEQHAVVGKQRVAHLYGLDRTDDDNGGGGDCQKGEDEPSAEHIPHSIHGTPGIFQGVSHIV
jgi:hypothetical protein